MTTPDRYALYFDRLPRPTQQRTALDEHWPQRPPHSTTSPRDPTYYSVVPAPPRATESGPLRWSARTVAAAACCFISFVLLVIAAVLLLSYWMDVRFALISTSLALAGAAAVLTRPLAGGAPRAEAPAAPTRDQHRPDHIARPSSPNYWE